MNDDGALDITASREFFERVVEALFARRFDGIHAVEGKGGDAGADLVSADGRVIVQLKFFPRGIGYSRHEQIERSWRRARETHPALQEWILVVPCKLTNHDRRRMDELRQHEPGIRVSVWDRPRIDIELAANPDLAGYFRRTDYLRESAQIFGAEQAFLSRGGQDLAARTSALAERASHLNPNWRLDFSHDGQRPHIRIQPKHASAQQLDPIHLVAVLGPEGSAEARSQLHDSLSFGIVGELLLEPPLLETAGFLGPAELGLPPQQPATLRLAPAASDLSGTPAALVLRAPDIQGGTHTGRVEASAVGSVGGTLVLKFYECLTLEYRVPRVPGRCRIQLHLEAVGHFPQDVLKAARMILQMLTSTTSRLTLGGSNFDLQSPRCDIDLAELTALQTLVEDLSRLQEHTGVAFPLSCIPDAATAALIRAICAALDDGQAPDPRFAEGVSARLTIRPEDAPDVEAFVGRRVAMTLTQDFEIQLGADTLVVKCLQIQNAQALVLSASPSGDLIILEAEWPAGETSLLRPKSPRLAGG